MRVFGGRIGIETGEGTGVQTNCARSRGGFTLIEVLVTMTILTLLAGMIAGASWYAIVAARRNATQVVLKELHNALSLRWEKFIQDTQQGMPVTRYQVFAGEAVSPPVEANSVVGKRAAILARIDSMRSAFPQSFAELVPSQALVNAFNSSQNPVQLVGAIDGAANTAFGNSQSQFGFAAAPIINPYPTHQTMLIRYLLATKQIASQNQYQQLGGVSWAMSNALTNPPNHDPKTESSECLYLILSDNTTGEDILEKISTQFLRDTDGDGLMEIVDSWGQPIQYYRWPTDLWAHFIEVTRQVPASALDNNLDQEDLLYQDPNFFANTAELRRAFEMLYARLHLAYNQPGQPTPPFPNVDAATGANGVTANANTPREYPFQPILVSAGPDTLLGLYDRETIPNGLSNPAARPQTFLPIRCGRVEEDLGKRGYVNDNLYSIELQEGAPN